MSNLVSYALTTVADVKETLGISAGDTTKDNLIIRKINQATDMIESWCGYDTDHHIKSQTYTNERYLGTGTNELVLKARPVTAVSDFGQATTTENDSDFDTVETDLYFTEQNSGMLRTNFSLYPSPQFYRVSYTAGYTTIPSDIAEACATLAAFLVDNAQTGSGVKRKTEGSRSIEYFDISQNAGSTKSNSIIDTLGLDDVLSRYMMPSLAGW